MARTRDYRPIGDKFDSGAVFCSLLDAEKGGFFQVGPEGHYTVSRAYAGETNVLVSRFANPAGAGLLGNCPQGFTHLALIRSTIKIGKAEAERRGRQACAAGESGRDCRQQ